MSGSSRVSSSRTAALRAAIVGSDARLARLPLVTSGRGDADEGALDLEVGREVIAVSVFVYGMEYRPIADTD